MSADYIVPLDVLSMADVPSVGGKNASLGEMIRHLSGAGVRVPGGFATTAQAFRDFLDHNDLRARIDARLTALDVADVTALAQTGAEIRAWVAAGSLPPALEAGLRAAYAALGSATMCRWQCARRPRPRTCPMPRLPASRKPTCTCAARMRCWRT